MKKYLSIPNLNGVPNYQDLYVLAFDKKDGSQIRAQYNKKRGFYKFGTKNELIDAKTQPWGIAVPLIINKYQEALYTIFKHHKWDEVNCFFELFGTNSFAGQHSFEEPMDVVLFDVNPLRKGILPPCQFIEIFGELDIPLCLYQGFLHDDIIEQIKSSTLPNMTSEGCVAKYLDDNNNTQMVKIKSRAWLERLKILVKNNQELFERLS
jgi:hypothetical protein